MEGRWIEKIFSFLRAGCRKGVPGKGKSVYTYLNPDESCSFLPTRCIPERGEMRMAGVSGGTHGAWSAVGKAPTLLPPGTRPGVPWAVLSPSQGAKSAAVRCASGAKEKAVEQRNGESPPFRVSKVVTGGSHPAVTDPLQKLPARVLLAT